MGLGGDRKGVPDPRRGRGRERKVGGTDSYRPVFLRATFLKIIQIEPIT